MVRRYLKMAFAMGLAALAVGSTPSCADNHESIFVQGVIALTAPDCTAKADAGAKLLAYGIMELKLTNTYGNFLSLGNQLIGRGNPNQLRAEPNRVQITGADITLTDTSGKQWGFYSVPSSGVIDPTITATPTYAPVFVELIPASVGEKLRAGIPAGTWLTLLADVKVYGQTLGLTNVETGSFVYSVQVTNGGTITRTYSAAGALDCTLVPASYTFVESCFVGQDVSATPCASVCASNPADAVCK